MAVHPIDVILTKFAVEYKDSNSYISLVKKIINYDGILGLYSGCSVNILGVFLYGFIYEGMYK